MHEWKYSKTYTLRHNMTVANRRADQSYLRNALRLVGYISALCFSTKNISPVTAHRHEINIYTAKSHALIRF